MLVLEEWHESLCCAARDALEENRDLPDCQRLALAVLRACQLLERNRVQDFFEFDVPVLLNRLPTSCTSTTTATSTTSAS